MEHLKKYWIAYTALAIGLIVLAMNWKNWFGGANGTGTGTGKAKQCVCPDGKEYPGIPSNSPRCIKGCMGVL